MFRRLRRDGRALVVHTSASLVARFTGDTVAARRTRRLVTHTSRRRTLPPPHAACVGYS